VYLFVCLRRKAGWLTRRCQTTAWKASDKGVTASTVRFEVRHKLKPGVVNRTAASRITAGLALSIKPFPQYTRRQKRRDRYSCCSRY